MPRAISTSTDREIRTLARWLAFYVLFSSSLGAMSMRGKEIEEIKKKKVLARVIGEEVSLSSGLSIPGIDEES